MDYEPNKLRIALTLRCKIKKKNKKDRDENYRWFIENLFFSSLFKEHNDNIKDVIKKRILLSVFLIIFFILK